eukprot:360894-Chlamydomonas_euryale.AAC.2
MRGTSQRSTLKTSIPLRHNSRIIENYLPPQRRGYTSRHNSGKAAPPAALQLRTLPRCIDRYPPHFPPRFQPQFRGGPPSQCVAVENPPATVHRRALPLQCGAETFPGAAPRRDHLCKVHKACERRVAQRERPHRRWHPGRRRLGHVRRLLAVGFHLGHAPRCNDERRAAARRPQLVDVRQRQARDRHAHVIGIEE